MASLMKFVFSGDFHHYLALLVSVKAYAFFFRRVLSVTPPADAEMKIPSDNQAQSYQRFLLPKPGLGQNIIILRGINSATAIIIVRHIIICCDMESGITIYACLEYTRRVHGRSLFVARPLI